MTNAIIVDIDGTVATIYDDDGEAVRGIFEYDAVGSDFPIDPIIELVKAVHKQFMYPTILFITGREDYCEVATREWLNQFFDPKDYLLFMRKTGDRRKNAETKMELYAKNVQHRFNVLYAFDDMDTSTDFWRRCGLTCLQVAPDPKLRLSVSDYLGT